MAHYSKLLLNDTEYEYHIGKHYVVIKGIEGNGNIAKTDFFHDHRGNDGDLVVNEIVTPGMIADYINGTKIRSQKKKYATPTCGCRKPLSEKVWRCNPYDAEINQVYNYAMICDECYQRIMEDI